MMNICHANLKSLPIIPFAVKGYITKLFDCVKQTIMVAILFFKFRPKIFPGIKKLKLANHRNVLLYMVVIGKAHVYFIPLK